MYNKPCDLVTSINININSFKVTSWPSHIYSEETSQKDTWKVWYSNIFLNSLSSNLSLAICFWPALIFWLLPSHSTHLSYGLTSQIVRFLPPLPVSVEIWGFCLHDLTPLEKEKMQQIAFTLDHEATTTLSSLCSLY